ARERREIEPRTGVLALVRAVGRAIEELARPETRREACRTIATGEGHDHVARKRLGRLEGKVRRDAERGEPRASVRRGREIALFANRQAIDRLEDDLARIEERVFRVETAVIGTNDDDFADAQAG